MFFQHSYTVAFSGSLQLNLKLMLILLKAPFLYALVTNLFNHFFELVFESFAAILRVDAFQGDRKGTKFALVEARKA